MDSYAIHLNSDSFFSYMDAFSNKKNIYTWETTFGAGV